MEIKRTPWIEVQKWDRAMKVAEALKPKTYTDYDTLLNSYHCGRFSPYGAIVKDVNKVIILKLDI